MDKVFLLMIKNRLEELYTEWYIANRCKDLRSRNKRIRDACVAIGNYADSLLPEVLGLFDTKVALSELSPQFAGMIFYHAFKSLKRK